MPHREGGSPDHPRARRSDSIARPSAEKRDRARPTNGHSPKNDGCGRQGRNRRIPRFPRVPPKKKGRKGVICAQERHRRGRRSGESAAQPEWKQLLPRCHQPKKSGNVHQPSLLFRLERLMEFLRYNQLEILGAHFIGLIFRDAGLEREQMLLLDPDGL